MNYLSQSPTLIESEMKMGKKKGKKFTFIDLLPVVED